MSDELPTSRLARGGELGKYVARQAMRNAKNRVANTHKPHEVKQEAAEKASLQAAEDLLTVLGGMKGAAMKIGQMLSMLDTTLIPAASRESFRNRLSALQSQAPVVAFEQMQRVIEIELGRPLNAIFSEFDSTAIASASIGQVYRAKLPDGRTVAVKVQYPGVASAVRADLKNLALFLKFSKPIVPTLAMDSFSEELSKYFESELDYRQEAQTQHNLAVFFSGHPFIAIPDVIDDLCTEHVLITEFNSGKRFSEIQSLPQEEKNRIGEIIYRFYVGTVYKDNHFNGDPHPGNVLLGNDGKVVFLDFGLYKHMDARQVDFERQCLIAGIEGRSEDLYQLMKKAGIIPAQSSITPEQTMEYIYSGSPWSFINDDIHVTPEIASSAISIAIDPRSEKFQLFKEANLPPEHFFSRRADFYTFGVLGQLQAEANWHRILCEWLYDKKSQTALGKQDEQWRMSRSSN
ncbi:MAG: ABC1 kinase family protein [Mycobacteriaceae bacterium]